MQCIDGDFINIFYTIFVNIEKKIVQSITLTKPGKCDYCVEKLWIDRTIWSTQDAFTRCMTTDAMNQTDKDKV